MWCRTTIIHSHDSTPKLDGWCTHPEKKNTKVSKWHHTHIHSQRSQLWLIINWMVECLLCGNLYYFAPKHWIIVALKLPQISFRHSPTNYHLIHSNDLINRQHNQPKVCISTVNNLLVSGDVLYVPVMDGCCYSGWAVWVALFPHSCLISSLTHMCTYEFGNVVWNRNICLPLYPIDRYYYLFYQPHDFSLTLFPTHSRFLVSLYSPTIHCSVLW